MGSDQQKLITRKSFSKQSEPLMLKDYLKDDLGSCSSNGFRSFPRRPCCTTVRFLIEIELKAKDRHHSTTTSNQLLRSRSKKAALTTLTALQRASCTVVNAVKQLPVAFRQKRLSRKLSKNSSRRKPDHKVEEQPEIGRWRVCDGTSEPVEQANSSDQIKDSTRTSSSDNSSSWGESGFTSEMLRSSSDSECSVMRNVVVAGKNELPDVTVGKKFVGEATTTATTPNAKAKKTKECPREEKEQFSPISVLDCPFKDEEETNSPPTFQCRLARIEGTEKKLLQKINRFENLAQLEPIDLQKRFALFSELEEEEEEEDVIICEKNEESSHNKTIEHKANELLKLTKSKTKSKSHDNLILLSENLLLDFFQERIDEQQYHNANHDIGVLEMLDVAEDWINGGEELMVMGWEVDSGRSKYVREMEKGGKWRSNLDEEKDEVVSELEVWVLNFLMDNLIHDFM